MFEIKVTSTEKKANGKELFHALYPTFKEAMKARTALIRIAGERRFAPSCKEYTGRDQVYVKPGNWHINPIVEVK